MKNKGFLYIILSLFISVKVNAVQLSGFVRDLHSGEALIGANVFEKNQNSGTTTDNRGYFSLKVTSPCKLEVSYIGYQTKSISLQNPGDTLIVVQLEPGNNLSELTVTASREKNFDLTRLSAKELSQIPALGGKPDVIKALQLLPGVQTQSEGMSLMLVRGGEPGQNLYLLDNVPLIYVNHLGGLMSVFNPDMINAVDFYKGNFPARHGGKLSSIVDITQREGDLSKHQGSFSLGLTDASFTFEGPLAGKKMSYIVTARKTLVDGLLAGVSTISEGNNAIVSYGFHDVNAKLSWRPDERNNLSFNLYQGDDYLNFWTKPWKMYNQEKSHIHQQWGNWLVSGRWNHVFNSKFYAENILSYSRYRNKSGQDYISKTGDQTVQIESENMSSVNDFSLRSAWKYSLLKQWNMDFGAHIGYLIYAPNDNYLSTSVTPKIGDIYHAVESSVYLDNKISLFKGMMFQPSFRMNYFANSGKNFFSLEPRINLSYHLNRDNSLNINYMRVSQNAHLVFVQSDILKREVWLPASAVLPPELSSQFSASWLGNFANSKYSVESNVYYKQMEHLVTLKEGYENMLNLTGIENKIESNGKGLSYGAECLVRKNSGNWTGSLAYAWSYSNRTFAQINGGKSYEFDFNRPHSLTLTVNRELGKKWTMNTVWIYQSGSPFTPALGKLRSLNPNTGKFDIEMIYGTKNADRLQAYHRLDIGFNHEITTRRGNKAVWTYSLYNAYNHINPFGYYYDNDMDLENLTQYNRPLQLYKTGLFSIIPSISYKVWFDYSKKPKPIKLKEKKKNSWLYLN